MAGDGKSRLKRSRNAMSISVRRALDARGLMHAYLSRPPYQRNDYLGWIQRAKRTETRSKRLEQMLEELAGGKLYMNMRWRASRAGR
jgi:uncharacterized protein YdeI (YjbR/CyaY-like superfamily)